MSCATDKYDSAIIIEEEEDDKSKSINVNPKVKGNHSLWL